jgi:ABC-2 type transport system permease protein
MHLPRKALIVAATEASMTIRSKAFIIGMAMMPVFVGLGTGFQKMTINQADREERRFAVVDEAGALYDRLARRAEEWNRSIVAASGGPATGPRVVPERVNVDGRTPDEIRRQLVARIRRKELKAFVEIPADVTQNPVARIRYYSDSTTDPTLPRWVDTTLNRAILDERFESTAIDRATVGRLTRQVPVTRLGLPSWDERGVAKEASAADPIRAVAVPMVAMLLVLFVVMTSAPPLLNSVLEEKLSRTNEVMLGSVSPFEFMAGKLLGSASVSLLVAAIYLTGIFAVARSWGYADMISGPILGAFVVSSLLAVFLFGSLFIAIGSACSELKDAQSMMAPAMMLVMLPMMVWPVVLRAPTGTMATVLSLVPTASPFLMLPLMTIPPGPPVWQPLLAVVLTTSTTVLFVWAAGRIFRVGLLMQGKSATIGEMMRWVRTG